MTWPFKGHS